MKKIIFIANNNLGKGNSGGDTIFLQLIKHWQKKLSIHVIACKETEYLINKNQIKNIPIILTTQKPSQKNFFSISNLILHVISRTTIGVLNVFKNRQLIKKADYVYSVSDFYPDLIPGLFSKIINPKIRWIAGYYLVVPPPFSKNSPYKHQFFKGLFYWLMQIPSRNLVNLFADFVYLTSDPDKKYFPKKRTIIVQGGVDLEKIGPYINSKSDKKYDAVFMGRLHPQKGVLELIDIWKSVIKKIPSAQLAIIGDGQLEIQTKQRIKKLKLNRNVTLFGFQNGLKKYQIFNSSKIVVHPAIFDSGGMAAAEAMAFSLPGVSYDLESLKTYYPQGLIKTHCFDQNQFSENIIILLQDQKLYKRLSKSAQSLIYKQWDWRKKAQYIYLKTFKA